MMRTAVLLAIIALASAAAAGETSWSQTVAEWLDHYGSRSRQVHAH